MNDGKLKLYAVCNAGQQIRVEGPFDDEAAMLDWFKRTFNNDDYASVWSADRPKFVSGTRYKRK